MSYYVCVSICIRCQRTFGFNPHKVPTIRLTPSSEKEPLCEICHQILVDLQKRMNIPIWPDPLPGAYEPVNEDQEEHEDIEL